MGNGLANKVLVERGLSVSPQPRNVRIRREEGKKH